MKHIAANPELLKIEDVRDQLGVDLETVKAWIRRGDVPWGQYIKERGKARGMWIIRRRVYEAWLDGRR